MNRIITAKPTLPVKTETTKWEYLFNIIEQMAYMLFAVFVLQLFSQNILEVSNLTVLAYSLLLAIPVWFYQKEYYLYKRRIFLSSVGTEQGQAVRWFWDATGFKFWLHLKSIFFAFSIISISSFFSDIHWYIIYTDVFIIVLIQWLNNAWIKQEVKPAFYGLVNRRVLYILNALLILTAIIYIDFVYIGSIDTRNMQWFDVFANTFNEYFQQNNHNYIRYFISLVAAFDALGWHYMQVLAPEINNINLRLFAWLLFLTPAAINITLILFYLLGVHNLVEIKQNKGWMVLGQSIASKAFMITIITLASISICLSTLEITPPDVTEKINKLRNDTAIATVLIDPCVNHNIEVEKLLVGIEAEIADSRKKIIANINKSVNLQLNQAFQPVERGIDNFLNWYYTVAGEYERLISVLSADAGRTVREQLHHHLFKKANFSSSLDNINASIIAHNLKQLSHIINNISAKTKQLLFKNSCTLPEITFSEIDAFNRDYQRASASVITGGVIGMSISKGVGKAATTAMVNKITGKKIFKGAISLLIKAGAKKGGSSFLVGIWSGVVAGLVCGPGCSIAGGIASGVAAWIAVDRLIIEVDEHLNRTEFKKEILNTITQQKKSLSAAMKKNHYQKVDAVINEINKAIKKDFIPYKDSF